MSSYVQCKNQEKSDWGSKSQGDYLSAWGWRDSQRIPGLPLLHPILQLQDENTVFLQRKMLSFCLLKKVTEPPE